MQPSAVVRALRFLSVPAGARLRPLYRALSTSSTAAGAGDTAIHSEDPQGDDAEEAAKSAMAEEKQRAEHKGEQDSSKPLDAFGERRPPFASSPKLESHGTAPPTDPSFQQKRRFARAAADRGVLDEFTCVGPDGRPLVSEGGAGWEDSELERDDDDDKEYYAHHKASPLSEIEFADTRKPINRATEGRADDDAGRGVTVKDTVDASLARAESMFRERAASGVPDMPHSKVLARMLKERERRLRGSAHAA